MKYRFVPAAFFRHFRKQNLLCHQLSGSACTAYDIAALVIQYQHILAASGTVHFSNEAQEYVSTSDPPPQVRKVNYRFLLPEPDPIKFLK